MIRTLFIIYIIGISEIISARTKIPEKVLSLYNSMTSLSNAKDINDANMLQIRIQTCFWGIEEGGSSSGINIPNDFFFLGNEQERKTISSSNYARKLRDNIYSKKNISVKYRIINVTDIYPPDFYKSRNPSFIDTQIERTIMSNNKIYTIKDLVSTDYITGKIVCIINDKINVDDLKAGNIEGLRARAATYYNKKEYDYAYKMYLKVIQQYPEDYDTNYRLAVMTYWKKGCEKLFSSNKEARIKAKEYLMNAKKNCKNIEEKNKINNFLNNIDFPRPF